MKYEMPKYARTTEHEVCNFWDCENKLDVLLSVFKANIAQYKR